MGLGQGKVGVHGIVKGRFRIIDGLGRRDGPIEKMMDNVSIHARGYGMRTQLGKFLST